MLRRSLFALTVAALFAAASPVFAEPHARLALESPVASGGPAGVDGVSGPSIDLAGEWRMLLPAGWEQTVTLERLSENRYYFRPPYVMKGTYELAGDRLVRLSEDRVDGDDAPKSDLASNQAFAWKIRSRHLLTLVDDADSRSDDYAGASLFRGRQKLKHAQAKAEASPSRSAEAPPAESEPAFAIDVPKTELDVRLFPAPQGSLHPDGELWFPITIRNQSATPIAFDLPAARSSQSSIAARVRRLDPPVADGGETPSLYMHVYRAEEDAATSAVTLEPGEQAEFDVRLNWFADVSDRRPLRTTPKYEIHLLMTFAAEDKLQSVSGPRGSVVSFQTRELVR